MAAERWLCAACGASTDPAPEPPPGCPRCDAPLYFGKVGLLAELPPERSARVFRGREAGGPAEVTVRLFPAELLPSLPQIRQAVKKASTLDHPTIAAPLDAGAHQTKVYVTETWAPGEPVLGAQLTLREAAGVVHDAAVALGHAEDRGIVHPDLRPENLRVRRVPGKGLGESDLRVLVTCFGIAPGGNAQHSVRVLGTILFALATGRAPREWTTESPSAINPLVGSTLESIILLALESEPSRRPPSARQIADELRRYLDGGTPSGPPLKSAEATKTVRPRIPPRAVTLAAAAAAILVALVILVTPHRQPLPEAPVAKAGGTPAEPPPPPPKEVPHPVEPPPPAPPPKPPPEPAPEPPKPIEPVRPVEPAKVVEPPRPAEPVKPAETTKPVEPVKPAEPEKPVEPPKPAEPVKPSAPAKPPPEPPVAPPPAARGSIGTIQGVHPEYGVFVKLEAGGKVAVGDILDVVRKEEVVARLKVERVTAPEKLYPNGCAVCKAERGEPAPGDFVRRTAR